MEKIDDIISGMKWFFMQCYAATWLCGYAMHLKQ